MGLPEGSWPTGWEPLKPHFILQVDWLLSHFVDTKTGETRCHPPVCFTFVGQAPLLGRSPTEGFSSSRSWQELLWVPGEASPSCNPHHVMSSSSVPPSWCHSFRALAFPRSPMLRGACQVLMFLMLLHRIVMTCISIMQLWTHGKCSFDFVQISLNMQK